MSPGINANTPQPRRKKAPRIEITPDVFYFHFEGKQDLERKIEAKIRLWQLPDTVFLVMRDQDSDDCRQVKARLVEKIVYTGKSEKVVIRIACHELESFYLGDLLAVENGLAMNGLSKKQKKSPYRNPDSIPNPVQILIKLTKNKYQKIQGSRSIAPHMDLESNCSVSFQALLAGIRHLSQEDF